MKRSLSFILALFMLASSLIRVSLGEGSLTLKDTSMYRLSEDGAYIVGIEGIPDADFVRAQFTDPDSVRINDPSGQLREGKIASDDEATCGDSHIKLLVYGDLDRSATINARDVMLLMRSLCGYDQDICDLAGDVNVDLKTNAKDVVLLMRSIVGADVVLGDITYPAEEFKIDDTYRIIISEDADDTELEAASLLTVALDSLYGMGMGNKRIIPDTRSAANEIIVGKCNRQYYGIDRRKLSSDGYFYDVIKPSRIVIAGTDSEGTYAAVKRFLWDVYAYIDKYNTVDSKKIWNGTDYVDVHGSTTVVSGKSLFYTYPEAKASVTLNGVAIENYTVVPRDEHFAECAAIFVRNVRLLTGRTLKTDIDYSGANAVYIGRTANGGNYSSSGLSYNIGREGDSIYIDAYRLNVCRFAVRAFSDDYLLNDCTDREITIEGNALGAFNSNRLKLTASSNREITPGVTYIERSYVDPHSLPVKTFAVVIKSGTGRLALGTPGGETAISGNLATTTSEMKTLIAGGKNVICGINADFFDLGGTNYPKGLCVKDGTLMQESQGRPWFAVMKDGSYAMGTGNDSKEYLENMETAVGGSHLFVRKGLISNVSQDTDFGGIRHPRTALGYTEKGDVVFIVVDGRRPEYSNGASLTDLALLALEYGVTEAINLDGGGSSTLALVEGENVEIKNSPCDVFERPVYDSIALIID